MKTIAKFFTPILMIMLSFGIFSCNRDADDQKLSDPFIGVWKLRAFTGNGETIEVTNIECWKDTTLNVFETTGALEYVYPDQNTGQCANMTGSFQWVNSNGNYYSVENGQQELLPIKLLDNNQTLQFTTIDDDSNIVIFSFRK